MLPAHAATALGLVQQQILQGRRLRFRLLQFYGPDEWAITINRLIVYWLFK